MRVLFLICFSLIGLSLNGQIFNPVKWSTAYEQIGEGEFKLQFTATIDEGWVIYSQYLESEDGPIPTGFYFEEGNHFELVGKNEESGNRKEAYDKVFDMQLIKFYKKAVFTQKVKVADLNKPIKGYLEFMTCDDERCLPPTEEEFSFTLQSIPADSRGAAEPAPAATEPTTTKTGVETIASNSTPAIIEEASTITVIPQSDNQPTQGTIGEILDPVSWSLKLNPAEANVYELIFTAEMEKGWSIYSQHTNDNGPTPTEFVFDEGGHFKLLGDVVEIGKKKEGPDPFFDNVIVIKYPESPVTFTQKIEATNPDKVISGYLVYMTCDDKQCLAATEVPFQVTPGTGKILIGAEASVALDEVEEISSAYLVRETTLGPPAGECSTTEFVAEKKSFWGIFVLGFLGGLLALLTPCVFPMIPLTVSFFTKGSEDKRKGFINAFMYGLFIFMVYLILSIPFHLMDTINPDILNDISTNIWLNIAFFAIFLFFAFSFFGYYELTIPSSWTNKVAAAEGIGGMIGIFFMALTLALVSFSCTGPILGSLLAGALSADGGAWQLSAGMAGFGLALALPFALFAAFPGWMKSLPKSGGWLNSVKVVLGFLELALALKFLSNADLVKHWGLLKIEPFLGLWFVIFVGLGFYLLGKIKFPHDSPIKKLSMGRIGLAIASFAFAIYLATGFMYDDKAGSFRSLKLLSGLAPPTCYSWIYPCDCPQNLNCFKDFESGLAYAKEVNKPIMIDFTGHACVNCRKMEENVWPEGDVYKILKNDYVLISLYVDEKVELPEEEQIVVEKATGGTRKLRNYGHKWSHFQTEYFNTNTQPYYVLLSPDGKKLNNPVGYTPDSKAYSDFLKCGVETFNNLDQHKQLGAN